LRVSVIPESGGLFWAHGFLRITWSDARRGPRARSKG
jgi:hypothetical protein